jgi:hypothetical protein
VYARFSVECLGVGKVLGLKEPISREVSDLNGRWHTGHESVKKMVAIFRWRKRGRLLVAFFLELYRSLCSHDVR